MTTPSRLPAFAALALDALDDFERCIAPITKETAGKRLSGANPIAQTVVHVARQIDSWVNVSMGGMAANEGLPADTLRIGPDGNTVSWTTALRETRATMARARKWLESASEAQLDVSTPYRGSYPEWQEKRIDNHLRLARMVAHIYYHIGEINTLRSTLGEKVEDFPNQLPRLMR